MMLKLTPGLKRWLEFIAGDRERGRMLVQITASGGRASSQLQALRNAGYVEYWEDPQNPTAPERVRVTAVGHKALITIKEPIRYKRDGDRYIVHIGDDRIGFVRYAPSRRRWNAVDTTMVYIRWFDTRDAAGKALHRRFTTMMRDGRL
jgi:hypothetical protein